MRGDGAGQAVGGLQVVHRYTWAVFALDLARLKREMNTPVIVDLRNIYRAEQVRGKGFSYTDVGRGTSEALAPAKDDAA